MSLQSPSEILIECGACGIENIYSDYSPDKFLICNQCRDGLLHPNFNDTHNEYRCQDCGFSVCLLKETEFEVGNTPCRCSSLNILPIKPSQLYDSANKAGAFNFEEDLEKGSSFDWYRSEPENKDSLKDYNEMFDQDPGAN